MLHDWPELIKLISGHMRTLRSGAPETMKAFSAMAVSASAGGALDAKTTELMALAIGVATRCDDCIAFHVKGALQQGATREEIMETLALSVYMGAGPSVMYASHAIDAYAGFTQTETPPTS